METSRRTALGLYPEPCFTAQPPAKGSRPQTAGRAEAA